MLAKIQLKSCHSYTLAELLNNLREVASIDDLPFQHGIPLTTERETGSEKTILADCESDLQGTSQFYLPRLVKESALPPSTTIPGIEPPSTLKTGQITSLTGFHGGFR